MPHIQVSFQDKRLASYELGEDDVTIGRAPSNDIPIDNPGVSAAHAIIRKQGEDYLLEDLGSKNGTYVRGQKIRQYRLEPGDVISIFKHQLHFVPLAARLIGKGGPLPAGGLLIQSQTVKIDIVQQDALMPAGDCARLTVTRGNGSKQVHELRGEEYCIGKGADCQIRTKGLLAPAVSAWLSHQDGGFLLTPARKDEVILDSLPLEMPRLLEDGDRIEIRGLVLVYRTKRPQEG
ncbi:MAG: FHA domain-containing protein [Gammaproteobacteria bacterium]|nr:FHA domain-containing protein [Gammaproteobacteria bacterium]MBU1655577.1 FHA domain-containing protein [Gammaproteobacteria bacterium]MBU1960274.1 FHA domain-containing protein [Gammaproteobacteria bacterium]